MSQILVGLVGIHVAHASTRALPAVGSREDDRVLSGAEEATVFSPVPVVAGTGPVRQADAVEGAGLSDLPLALDAAVRPCEADVARAGCVGQAKPSLRARLAAVSRPTSLTHAGPVADTSRLDTAMVALGAVIPDEADRLSYQAGRRSVGPGRAVGWRSPQLVDGGCKVCR
eukprot:753985-Hanusia_phi.AAC.4